MIGTGSTKLTSPLYSIPEQHDTGWINCTDWTNQFLGDTVGNNVVHNFGLPLSDLLIRVLISTDGTDANSFEPVGFMTFDGLSGQEYGYFIDAVDNNTISVITAAYGIPQYNAAGQWFNTITTESWYYRVIVEKKNSVISVRDKTGDYSTSETFTGNYAENGKPIYKRTVEGTTGAGASSDHALGFTVDEHFPTTNIYIDTVGFGWESSDADTGNGPAWFFLNATQDTIRVYHNTAVTQSRPFKFRIEYTKV